MYEAEFTHVGDLCTFEVLLQRTRPEGPRAAARSPRSSTTSTSRTTAISDRRRRASRSLVAGIALTSATTTSGSRAPAPRSTSSTKSFRASAVDEDARLHSDARAAAGCGRSDRCRTCAPCASATRRRSTAGSTTRRGRRRRRRDAFTQKFPNEGEAPSERTTMRVLYDDDAVYVGVDCQQRTAPIVGRLTRRDRPIEADSVAIDLDSRRSGKSAFEFTVNAAGVLSDGDPLQRHRLLVGLGRELGRARRANAPTAGRPRSASRCASCASTRRCRCRAGASRCAATSRRGRRPTSGRTSRAPRRARSRTTASSTSCAGSSRRAPFELRPFVLGRVRHRDAASAMLASGWDASGSAGLDLKWHVTQNLTLDATFNPDFAQVEADQVVLNLTTFEIFFPEKRPFFLEGVDAFSTPLQLLYTRRIGRAPDAPALRTERAVRRAARRRAGAVDHLRRGQAGRRRRRQAHGRRAVGADRAQHVAVAGRRQASGGASPSRCRSSTCCACATRLGDNATSASWPPRPTASSRRACTRCSRTARAKYALCPDGSFVGVDRPLLPRRVRRRPRRALALAVGRLRRERAGHPERRRQRPAAPVPRRHWIKSGDLGWGGYFDVAKQGGKHWLFEVEYDVASQQARLQRPRLHGAPEPQPHRSRRRVPHDRAVGQDARDPLARRVLRPREPQRAQPRARLPAQHQRQVHQLLELVRRAALSRAPLRRSRGRRRHGARARGSHRLRAAGSTATRGGASTSSCSRRRSRSSTGCTSRPRAS